MMDDLSPQERRELTDLADELVEATGGPYWLNQARDTSLKLRERITRWLGRETPSETEPPRT